MYKKERTQCSGIFADSLKHQEDLGKLAAWCNYKAWGCGQTDYSEIFRVSGWWVQVQLYYFKKMGSKVKVLYNNVIASHDAKETSKTATSECSSNCLRGSRQNAVNVVAGNRSGIRHESKKRACTNG